MHINNFKTVTEFLFSFVRKDIPALIQKAVSNPFGVTGHPSPRQETGRSNLSSPQSPLLQWRLLRSDTREQPESWEPPPWGAGRGWQPASSHKHLAIVWL